MEIFTFEGVSALTRWIHILAGIVWIGLLYYFNFVQTPFFAETEAGVRTTAIRQLVPRALAWFRYSALVTFLGGVLLIILKISDVGAANALLTPYGIIIVSGMGLGTLMFLNVWGVIWPKQKIVIASAEGVAAGKEANPRAADAGRRALLASRTNVVFSIPMLFFMVSSGHLANLFTPDTLGSKKLTYAIIATAIVLLIEFNALMGLTGGLKKPLEKVGNVIFSGFVLWVVLYVVLQVATA